MTSDKAIRSKVQNHTGKERLTCGTPGHGMLQKEKFVEEKPPGGY